MLGPFRLSQAIQRQQQHIQPRTITLQIQTYYPRIIVRSSTLVPPQLSGFQETRKRLVGLVQETQVIGGVKVHVGQLERVRAVDHLHVVD